MKIILSNSTIRNPEHPLFDHRIFLLFRVEDHVIYKSQDQLYCENYQALQCDSFHERDLINHDTILRIVQNAFSSDYNFQNNVRYSIEELVSSKIDIRSEEVTKRLINDENNDVEEFTQELRDKFEQKLDQHVESSIARIKAEILCDMKKELDQKMQDFNDRERSIFLDSLKEL